MDFGVFLYDVVRKIAPMGGMWYVLSRMSDHIVGQFFTTKECKMKYSGWKKNGNEKISITNTKLYDEVYFLCHKRNCKIIDLFSRAARYCAPQMRKNTILADVEIFLYADEGYVPTYVRRYVGRILRARESAERRERAKNMPEKYIRISPPRLRRGQH